MSESEYTETNRPKLAFAVKNHAKATEKLAFAYKTFQKKSEQSQ